MPENLSIGEYKPRYEEFKQTVSGRIENFTHVEGKDKIISNLLDRIGTVDWEIENYPGRENQRDLSIKFHWGHNHRFNEKFSVNGRMQNRHIDLLAEFSTGFDIGLNELRDKKILDVGCWTGGTSISLAAYGAGTIVAIEEVVKYASACTTLMQDVYGLDDFRCISESLYKAKLDDDFDIIYCPGVIYHLSDPVLALRKMFNATTDGGMIFIESAGIDHKDAICRFDGNRIYHDADDENEDQMNRGGWNWFIPSPKCVELWLLEAGFDAPRSFFSPVSNRVFAVAERTRFREITRAGLAEPQIR